ncbi:translation elongation factor Ts [Candidatus Amarolinea aalborgensis]|uniref:translation elongation factor Ts n=1 Tax=Candidatus Amarolinea aalborgensis TaxID=2249329 RepID=UPI003BF966F1
MSISADMIKKLRDLTGAGVLDCRKALDTAQGDMDKAVEILREKGLAAAAKKASREASNGIIGSYVHMGAKMAAMIEVNCETDFVARTDQFQALARDLAMQVVAARPLYVRREDVPADVVAQEREKYLGQLDDANKPQNVVERIIEGKLAKFYEETCLLEQPFIKDDGVTVRNLLTDMVARLGENIVVRRFARFELGN